MIPGPYAICQAVFLDEDSDTPDYKTLKYGYDSAEQAWADVQTVASEEGVPAEDCLVIRTVDREEASRFTD